MKTVTLGWLLKQNPVPSLIGSSNKYQYYYCPSDEKNPYTAPAKIVKIKRAYVISKNKELHKETE